MGDTRNIPYPLFLRKVIIFPEQQVATLPAALKIKHLFRWEGHIAFS